MKDNIVNRMKRIPLREFQLHASDYINTEFPIVLTRYNKPIAIITTTQEQLAKVHYSEEDKWVPRELKKPMEDLYQQVRPQPKLGLSRGARGKKK